MGGAAEWFSAVDEKDAMHGPTQLHELSLISLPVLSLQLSKPQLRDPVPHPKHSEIWRA